jgi:hypothetical protein
MCNVCAYEIAAYNMDLAPLSFLRTVIPGSFVTSQDRFLIMVRYSMADSQGEFELYATPSSPLVFYDAIHYAVYEQPVTEV